MSEQKKSRFWWVIVLLIVLGGLGYYYWQSQNAADPGQSAGGQGSKGPVSVTVQQVKVEDAVVYEDMAGRSVAYQSAEIRPQVSGIIVDRLFKEGSSVKKGDQLYQIDAAPYEAVYQSAQADLKKAEANLKLFKTKSRRLKDLVSQNAVSQQEYDDVQANLIVSQADIAIAKAALAKAEIQLEYTKVIAPIDGQIGKSQVTQGALVTANQPQSLASITQLDPMYVDMTMSSGEWMNLQPNIAGKNKIPVRLAFNSGKSQYPEMGTLEFAEVNVEQTTGSIELRALFPNSDKTLLPGLFVRTGLELNYPEVILIPQKATQRQPDGSLAVWRVQQGGKNTQKDSDNTKDTVQLQPIQIIRAFEDQWLVKEGLESGDLIVVQGRLNLKPDTQVKFENESQD